MSYELKIKSKELSEEARIIRAEEARANRIARKLLLKQKSDLADNHLQKRSNLAHHRNTTVRYESRATYLARAFLNGKDYSQVEAAGRRKDQHEENIFIKKILPKVYRMVNLYGNKSSRVGEKVGYVSMSVIEKWVGLS